MTSSSKINWNWLFKMAWRDSRRNRSRLLLFISSIILGIAALVSVYALSNSLREEVDKQAAELIGADLEISGNKPFSPVMQKLMDSLGDRRSEQRSFSSMVYFVKSGGTRLVQVKALGGEFPYYGKLETKPAEAGIRFRDNQQALVDKTLMMQFNARVGDTIKIGSLYFAIAGILEGAPGQTGLSSSVAPVIYMPLKYLSETSLEQKGSRINYTYYVKYDKPVDIKKLSEKLEPRLEKAELDLDTVESQKEQTARSFRDVTRFLSLVGFIALLLGCIGVASAINIYVREKISTIAILRCLGASSTQSFLIYLIQIIFIGFIGSVIGAILGTFIQQLLPLLLKDLLPIKIEPSISWMAIGQGILLGVIISILFALVPLISIRKISPLNTLRMTYQPVLYKDFFTWLVYALILAFIYIFTSLQLGSWTNSIAFTIGVILSFLILSGLAQLLMWLVRKFFPTSWSYVWRQGLANLYRPNNQTATLILSIGLGTALICTVLFIQTILLNRVSLSASGNQPNMVMFDIQTSQREAVMALARKEGLMVDGTVPIVNMRLESVNKITAESLKKDSSIEMQRWIFSREYRVTFRDTLISSEKIKAGKWSGKYTGGNEPVYVSLEEGIASRNHIKIGDTMVFNVQGSMIPTIVGSLREVDWNRIQTNFLVVFPSGVLEDAPQFHVIMTRVPSVEVSARFQQAAVREFPNVSIIDLGLVLRVVDDILNKIGFVIRFMAAFCMITGLVVLIASVLISKYQRMRESVLLRTMGASRRQIYAITALEYFFLGALAAFAGILLSLAGSWALAHYVFETSFTPHIIPILIIFFSVCALTVLIGLSNSRFIVSKPPLEILREES
jgi:putative ABC transport system permease protein